MVEKNPEKDESIRPWGRYFIIEQTKIIKVKPNQSLSLQYHNHRSEFWKIISGNGYVEIENKKFEVKEGDTYNINVKEIHRAMAGDKGMTILEKSSGQVDEKDIVRLEDKYGRK
jgi:mannose-6-phosphate isomerase-like protein (cupin superfamily)